MKNVMGGGIKRKKKNKTVSFIMSLQGSARNLRLL